MGKYMGQVMAECDCENPECNLRGYCMAQPRPNHHPPGSAAPRYVNPPKLPIVPLAIIAAFIGLAVWVALKTSVGAGL